MTISIPPDSCHELLDDDDIHSQASAGPIECCVQVMGSADAAARVQAFLLVREMGTVLPSPTLGTTMKVHNLPSEAAWPANIGSIFGTPAYVDLPSLSAP